MNRLYAKLLPILFLNNSYLFIILSEGINSSVSSILLSFHFNNN